MESNLPFTQLQYMQIIENKKLALGQSAKEAALLSQFNGQKAMEKLNGEL